MTRARYTFERSHQAVFIIDQNGPRSVTNDAEHVVHDLTERGIDVDRMVILYQDSDGFWDQLLTKRGEFTGFRTLHATTRSEAYRMTQGAR